MTPDEPGQGIPAANVPEAEYASAPSPEYTHFAEPGGAAAPADSDWSQPTLSRHAASEERPSEPVVSEPVVSEPVVNEAVPSAPALSKTDAGGTASGEPETGSAVATDATENADADTVAPMRHYSPFENAAPVSRPAESVTERTSNYYVPPASRRRSQVSYERGTVVPGHQALVERAADVAVAAMPIPLRVLDVGCGDGALLAELILRVPYAENYVGLDPLPSEVTGELRDSDPRLGLVRGAAESLPFGDARFDLVIAMLSFAYWKDQRAGLGELARVVADHGKVVIVEPTTGGGGRVPAEKEIGDLLAAAGLTLERTETVARSRLRLPTAKAYVAAP